MKHKNMYYDNRYKYKLNMLEPGLTMMKLIGVLFVTGILFLVAGWHWLCLLYTSPGGHFPGGDDAARVRGLCEGNI